MRSKVLKMAVDEEAVENIINNKLPPLLDYLESEVPAGGFLFGDLGVALVSPFVNAGYAGYIIDSKRWAQVKPTRKSAQRGSATARGGSKHA
jgi:glutathione S-transferase